MTCEPLDHNGAFLKSAQWRMDGHPFQKEKSGPKQLQWHFPVRDSKNPNLLVISPDALGTDS